MGFFDKPLEADASQAQTAYTPIPEGQYDLIVEKAELTRSKNNNEMLKLVFKVTEGEFAGRKLFQNLMLEHANEKVVQIAKAQLHAMLVLSGTKSIDGPSDLIGASFATKVVVTKRQDTGELQNEVKLQLSKSGADKDALGGKAGVKHNTSNPGTNKGW